MFEPDWRDLAKETVLPDVEAAIPADKLRGRKLADLKPTIAALPFYRHTSLVAFEEPGVPEPNKRYFLWSPQAGLQTLNWTNAPIYAANDVDGMVLSIATLLDYVRFFFHFVRGELGRFIMVETIDQITWLPGAEAREKGLAEIRQKPVEIGPLEYAGIHDGEELHVVRGYTIFKNALFRTDVLIAPYAQEAFDPVANAPEPFTLGQLKLTNENLLLEELPVPIDPPPGEFG